MSFSGLGRRLDRFAHRYMPDPFVLAILLTVLVAILGIIFGSSFEPDTHLIERLRTTISSWKAFIFEPKRPDGSTNKGLLYFAFQMCLMLVTGHALAASPPVAKVVRRIARLASNARTGASLTALVACTMALLHWGLGLIVGAMIAREVGHSLKTRNIAHHYPLIGAAGYTGLMVWGTGLSGSIPLAAAGQKGIPLESTMLSSTNLMIAGVLLFVIPIVAGLLAPSPDEYRPFPHELAPEFEIETSPSPIVGWLALGLALAGFGATLWGLSAHMTGTSTTIYAVVDGLIVAAVLHRIIHVATTTPPRITGESTPAQYLEHHPILVLIPVIMGLGWLQMEVLEQQFKLSFNNLNFAFLFLGLLFQGSIPRYVAAISQGAQGCAGIILQFPFYFGILGIMLATGLGSVIASGMASVADATTYPVLTYLSAGLVNLVVPSGGGQWVVQGAIVMEGAAAFPDIIPKAILALAFGDAWTNMLQPFWAVPLLAITGLRARDIIGYTGAIMLVGGAVTITLLLVL